MKRADKQSGPSNILEVLSVSEALAYIEKLKIAADKAHKWIAQQSSDPIEFLRAVKFEAKGFHPISHHEINLVEQVNQTWTYLVALNAALLLLEWHPDSGGLRLAPGAAAAQELDIMSVNPGVVGAETFAATSPYSNDKLKKDLVKMNMRSELHRYVFFAAPKFPSTQRCLKLERKGNVPVWSVEV
jgi:hypothetical protein